MELKQLEHFAAVARINHISKAAESLYITQSALSKSIMKLEEEIGFPLFQRNRNRIELNQNGREFLEYALRVLREQEALEEFCEKTRQRGRPLRFISADDYAYRHLIPSLCAHYPELEIRHDIVAEAELLEQLISYKAAAAIVTAISNDPRVTTLPLFCERASMIVPEGHRLYNRESLCLRDLNGETIVFSRSDAREAMQVFQRYKRLGVNIKLRYVEEWMMYTNAIHHEKQLVGASNISIKYLPPNPNSKNLLITDDIPGLTVYHFYFAFASSCRSMGDLYLKLKSVL